MKSLLNIVKQDLCWVFSEWVSFLSCFESCKLHVVYSSWQSCHGSHVFNLPFLKLMKENNVNLVCFPPHTTHWLQPADKTFSKSLKHSWTECGRSFIRKRGGKKPDRKEFFERFVPTWVKTASVETAQSGFRETGMFPVNDSLIPRHAFEPSLTTERPIRNPGGPTIYFINFM